MDTNLTEEIFGTEIWELIEIENSTIVPLPPGKLTFRPDERIVYRSIRIFLILLMTFSVITNGMVLHIFLNHKYGAITTAKLVFASISFSDELFLVGCVLYNFENYYTTNIATYLTQISGYVSGYSLALLAFKRFATMKDPFRNRPSVVSLNSNYGGGGHGRKSSSSTSILKSQWKLLSALGTIWGISILFSLILSGFGDFRDVIQYLNYSDRFFANCCYLISSRIDAVSNRPMFVILSFSVVPLSTGFFFSVRTILLLRKWNPPGESLQPRQVEFYKRLKRKSTVMILLVIFALLCWTPIFGFYSYEGLHLESRIQCDYNYNLYSGLLVLLMLGVTINPIIYWFLDPDFQNGLRTLRKNLFRQLGWLCCWRKDVGSANSDSSGRERTFTGLSGSSGTSGRSMTMTTKLYLENETSVL